MGKKRGLIDLTEEEPCFRLQTQRDHRTEYLVAAVFVSWDHRFKRLCCPQLALCGTKKGYVQCNPDPNHLGLQRSNPTSWTAAGFPAGNQCSLQGMGCYMLQEPHLKADCFILGWLKHSSGPNIQPHLEQIIWQTPAKVLPGPCIRNSHTCFTSLPLKNHTATIFSWASSNNRHPAISFS